MPDWLQEFKHGLVDESVPEHRHTFSSSHELPLEPRARVVPSKHNMFTHFPNDRSCDVCLRTKITRASCRRRTGTVVPRADNFGDLILRITKSSAKDVNLDTIIDMLWWYKTWLHNGYNPTHAKRKLLRKPRRAYRSSWSRYGNQKVIHTDNSLEFGKSCEELSWNRCTSTPHRSETNGIAERAVRRNEEGTSAVLLQAGLDETMVGGFHGMLLLSAKHSRHLGRWEDSIRETFWGPIIPFGLLVERKTYRDYINSVQKSCQEYSLDMRCTWEESGKETSWSQTLRNWSRWTHLNYTPEGSMQRKCQLPKMVNISCSQQIDQSKILERI